MSRVKLQVCSSNLRQLLAEFRLQLGWLVTFMDWGKEIQGNNRNFHTHVK